MQKFWELASMGTLLNDPDNKVKEENYTVFD